MTSLHYPILWKYTAREMQRRPGRTILTLLGIVLGVAAVVAIAVTTEATHRAYRAMFESVAGRASLEVVAEGLGGFDERIVHRLESVPGVKSAVPVIQTPAVLLGRPGGVGVMVLGIDPALDGAARDYVLHEGRPLDGKEGILLEVGFAQSQGLALGRPARLLTPVLTPTGPLIAELPVLGLLEPQGAATFNGGAVAFMTLPTAQRLFALKDRINSVQLVLTERTNLLQVEAAVRQVLPAGLTMQAPAARGELAQDSLLSTELGLGSLSVVSLVAGAFVILNTFLMNLGERRRQLAVLRALGATRRQITRLLLREAALLGITGTILGIAGGLALSLALRQVMAQLVGVTLPQTHLGPTPFLFAFVLGPGMAVAATFFPALRAGNRAPLEDLLQKGVDGEIAGRRPSARRRWPSYLGLTLVGAMLAIVLGMLRGWFAPAVIPSLLAPGVAMGLVGCVLVIPLVLAPLTSFAAFILQPVLGIEGRLAFRQLNRHPTRTALTVGVLFIGVVVSISFGQSLLNNVRDVYRWCDYNINFDFIVRGVMPDTTALITTAALPELLAEQIAALEGIDQVQKVSFVVARANGRQVVVLPFTLNKDKPLPFVLSSGDAAAALRGMWEGEVVVGTALAHRLGVGVGEAITLETRQGPQQLRIAGTTTEYTTGGMALYLEWNKGKELFQLQGVHAFAVKAQPGATAALAGRLQSFCDERGLSLQSKAEFRAVIDRAMAGVIGSFWCLVVLVLVVASLGIVNTLTMNVLEQTRELGLLRAIAMTRGQVRKMILSQALALGVISLLPGVVLGIGLAYLMNLGTHPVIGQRVAFHLDVSFVLLCFIAALVIALLSAYFPVRRAVRLQVIEALQYE